jgi:dTDP-4-dehydrorhamnose reductase
VTDLLVFGADSLVGSHFVETTRHRVHAAGRVDPHSVGLPVASFRSVDLTQLEAVAATVRDSSAEVVVNFGGATDVDAVERERTALEAPPRGPAYTVNALAPEAMASATKAGGMRFITLSTDFVFDGHSGPYPESAEPSPDGPKVGWYGWTKGEGERRARAAFSGTTVLRISYPYRARFPRKLDFARTLIARRRAGTLPPLFADQTITPTWIPDVTRALEHLIVTAGGGVLHAASPEPTSPREFGRTLFAQLEGREPELSPGSMREYLQRPGATPRPVQGGLAVGRLPSEGIPLTDWRHGIAAFLDEGGGK